MAALESEIKVIFEDTDDMCSTLIKGNLIGHGGSGSVFECTSHEDIVIKVSNDRFGPSHIESLKQYFALTENNSLVIDLPIDSSAVLEYIVYVSLMHIEDTRHITRLRAFYIENNRPNLAIEKLDTDFRGLPRALGRRLTEEDTRTVLFQVLYSLYITHGLDFNHRDLIRKNIMFKLVPVADEDYMVGPTHFKMSNRGFHFKLVDFDLSRITPRPGVNIYNTSTSRRRYNSEHVTYANSIDVCKAICNPRFVDTRSDPFIANICDHATADGCKFAPRGGWPAIPPYPDLSPRKILLSDFFKWGHAAHIAPA